MFSKPISAKVIFALALAILLAWAGHTSALYAGASKSELGGNHEVHSHADNEGAFACAACVDHYHSPLTADHAHETPYLTSLLDLGTVPEGLLPIEAPRYFFPTGPIFLIERPPRPTFVL
jgi:hypothetical protein